MENVAGVCIASIICVYLSYTYILILNMLKILENVGEILTKSNICCQQNLVEESELWMNFCRRDALSLPLEFSVWIEDDDDE